MSWFRVERSIFKHDLFTGEKFSRREAWLYLVAIAGYESNNAGLFSVTERDLAAEWGWSKSTVHRFLKELQTLKMIISIGPNVDQKRTIFRIENYERYQGIRTSAEPAGNTTRDRKADHPIIYKDLNNKQEQEYINPPVVPLKVSDEKPATTKNRKPIPISVPDVLPASLGSQQFREALESWLAHKRERGESYKPTGFKSLLAHLEKLGAERAIAAIEFSIRSNYAGIFEPKTQNTSPPGAPFPSRREREIQAIRDHLAASRQKKIFAEIPNLILETLK